MRYRKEYLKKNKPPKIIITSTPTGNNVWSSWFEDVVRDIGEQLNEI